MDGIRIWAQPVEPGQRLAILPGRRPPRGPARLRPSMDLGPPPGRSSATATSRSTRGTPPWRHWPRRRSASSSGCSSAPTRSATRRWPAKSVVTIDHISGGRAMFGHRRRLVRGRAPRLRHRLRVGLRAAARLAGRGRRRGPRAARRRDRHEPAGWPLRLRPTCGSIRRRVQAHLPDRHRRLGRAEDAADRRAVRGHLERLRDARTSSRPRIAILRDHCADVGRDQAEIERTVGCKITIRRTAEEAQRGRRRRARAQPHADVASRRRTTRSGPARPSRSPRRCSPTGASASGRSSSSALRPYDPETMETLISVVKPMVDASPD